MVVGVRIAGFLGYLDARHSWRWCAIELMNSSIHVFSLRRNARTTFLPTLNRTPVFRSFAGMPRARSAARVLAPLLSLAILASAAPAVAQEASPELLKQLLQRIEQLEGEVRELKKSVPPKTAVEGAAAEVRFGELEQKIKVVERKNELAQEAAAEKAKTAAVITAGNGGVTIRSADTNTVFRVRGYVQADARAFVGEREGASPVDTFTMRRVRPIFDGTVYSIFDYRLMLDLANGINSGTFNNGFVYDAYVTARFRPELQVQVGKMKEPVGLERLQSGSNLLFPERGLPTLVVPNRDVGVQLQGDLLDGALSYQIGAFNGVSDGGSGDRDTDDEKDLAARIFAQPFRESRIEGLRGLGIGIAGTYGNQEGAVRTYVTTGQQTLFGYRSGTGADASRANVVADGAHWRVAPQAYYYWGPVGLLAEYVISEQDLRRDDGNFTFGTFQTSAWQLAGSFMLTGEENSYKPVMPRRPFSLGEGGWGLFELVARVQGIQFDNDAFPVFVDPAAAASSGFGWGLGVNWLLNRNIRVSVSYDSITFEKSDAPTTTVVHNPLIENGEKVFIGRLQFSF